MSHSICRLSAVALALFACCCTTYEPAPVDLAAHAKAFAARLPEAAEIRAFLNTLAERFPEAVPFDASDGLSLAEGRLLALLFEPGARTQRARALVTAAGRDESGRFRDPEISSDVARILESVTYPWLAASAIGITIPLTGRHGLERALATSEHQQSLIAARIAEAHAIDALEAAWILRSASQQRLGLLRQLLARVRELEALAQRLQASGQLTTLGARAFSLERIAREAELDRAAAALEEAQLAVLLALGLPPTAHIELQFQLQVEPRVDAAHTEAALSTGPRLAAFHAAHDSAEHALELAVDQQWPQLTLLPGFREEDAQPRAALGFVMPLPIWNRNARAIAEASATRLAAKEQLQIALETSQHELATADVRCRAARAQQQRIVRDLLPLAEQQVAEGRQLANRGQVDPLMLLDALLRDHNARLLALETATTATLTEIARNSLFWPMLAVGEETR
jgi:cobalt-zinc-cadmium efflux system outer membrane protein